MQQTYTEEEVQKLLQEQASGMVANGRVGFNQQDLAMAQRMKQAGWDAPKIAAELGIQIAPVREWFDKSDEFGVMPPVKRRPGRPRKGHGN